MAEQSGFLSRWALRKQQVQAGEAVAEAPPLPAELPPEEPATAVVAEAQPQSEGASSPTEEVPLLTAEDLPDPEKIEIGGSFAEFMATNVDPDVKKNALRALWKQPHFAEVDGMAEYALDYSNQPKLSAEVSSQLARKVFRHLLEAESEAPVEVAATATEQDVIASATVTDTAMPTDKVTDNLDAAEPSVGQNAQLAEQETPKGVV